jgi:hypothetical protein
MVMGFQESPADPKDLHTPIVCNIEDGFNVQGCLLSCVEKNKYNDQLTKTLRLEK